MVRTTIRLIRHELTQANIERRYIGWTDQSIIQKVSADIAFTPSAIYGSDLKRCEETAACYFRGVPFVANAQLRETNFGDFEMKTYDELKNDLLYRAWIDDPLSVAPPNGESLKAFNARILMSFQEVIKGKEEATFIVHGGVIKAILANYLNKAFHDVHAAHRTIYTFVLDGGETCISYSEAPITVKDNMY